MVDFDVVRERLLRGAYVGAGSFASGFVGSMIESNLGTGNLGTAAGQVAIGAALSVGVDEVVPPRQNQMLNDVGEFVGYGIQGAGFANLGSALSAGQLGGSSSVEIVSSGSSSSSSSSRTSQAGREQEFLADVG